jgi:hypothetical protein
MLVGIVPAWMKVEVADGKEWGGEAACYAVSYIWGGSCVELYMLRFETQDATARTTSPIHPATGKDEMSAIPCTIQ